MGTGGSTLGGIYLAAGEQGLLYGSEHWLEQVVVAGWNRPSVAGEML